MVINTLRRAGEPALRRVLHLYWRVARGLTLGVRAVVLNERGEVFLIKHSYVSGWHLPGGGVEPGETALQALARELKEEANVTLDGDPVLHGIFFQDSASSRDHIAVYVVRDFRQDAAPIPDREIIGHGFFAISAMPEDTTRGTRARLAEVLEGAPVSERW